nr:MAG TPA: hypothetical protein [Caudoviricetes sp.]
MLGNIYSHQLGQTFHSYTHIDYMVTNYIYNNLYTLNHSQLDYSIVDIHNYLNLYTIYRLF